MKSFQHVGFSATQGWTLRFLSLFSGVRRDTERLGFESVDFFADFPCIMGLGMRHP
jgi:hypothetical protein